MRAHVLALRIWVATCLTMQPDGRNPSLLKRICVASSLAVLGRRRRGDLGTGGGLSLGRRRKDRAQDLLFLVQCTAHRVNAYLDFTSLGMVHVKGIRMAGIGKRNEVHLSDVIFFLFPPPTLDLPGFACHSPATVYLPSIPMWKRQHICCQLAGLQLSRSSVGMEEIDACVCIRCAYLVMQRMCLYPIEGVWPGYSRARQRG
jgi:hypothetical protein